MTPQCKDDPLAVARQLKYHFGLPIVDAQPVDGGGSVDLLTDQLDEAFATVRALGYTISKQLGVQADGRRSFTFVLHDDYGVRFVEI